MLIAAYRITGSMADAEDVTQTVFLRIANMESPIANGRQLSLSRGHQRGARFAAKAGKLWAAEPARPGRQCGLLWPRWFARGGGGEQAAWRHVKACDQRVISKSGAEMFALRYLEDLGNREVAALMGTSQAVVAVTLASCAIKIEEADLVN